MPPDLTARLAEAVRAAAERLAGVPSPDDARLVAECDAAVARAVSGLRARSFTAPVWDELLSAVAGVLAERLKGLEPEATPPLLVLIDPQCPRLVRVRYDPDAPRSPSVTVVMTAPSTPHTENNA